MATVLSISSQVVLGHVGNSAAVFALQRLGHEVWALPTVILAHHPGHDRAVPRVVTRARTVAAWLDALLRRGAAAAIDAVLVGYLGEASQAGAIAAALRRLKSSRPGLLVALDPVIGDDGALYVAAPVAAALRDSLLPLAGIATPNAFELGWLSGSDVTGPEAAVRAARALGPGEVLVTSAPGAPPAAVRSLLVTPTAAFACDMPLVAHAPHGAGDLMAALYQGHRLLGRPPHHALARAAAGVAAVLAETALRGCDELALVAAQASLQGVPAAPVVRL
jgi:pyridoxine kinase